MTRRRRRDDDIRVSAPAMAVMSLGNGAAAAS